MKGVKLLSFLLAIVMLHSTVTGCKKKEEAKGSYIDADSGFVFVPQEVTKAPVPSEAAREYVTTTFVITDNLLYDITLPKALDCLTNYATFVYAMDGSVTVSVLSGVDESNFSTSVIINNPDYVSPTLIKSKDGYKGPQEAAIFLDGGKAVVIRCYNNPVAFATLYRGLTKNKGYKPSRKDEVVTTKHTELLKALPSYEREQGNIISLGVDYSEPKQYYFDDGFLMIAQELKQFEDSKQYNNLRLSAASGHTTIDRYYEEVGSKYWIECGEFFVCVLQENFNTSRSFFGMGKEAKANMSDYLATL